LALNRDDHTKNISYLMDTTGTWRLAPAYDVTFAFNPKSRWTSRHQLSVNGKRNEITINDLTEVAKALNIKKHRKIIIEVLGAVNNWEALAKKNDVHSNIISGIWSFIRKNFSVVGI